MPLLSQSVGELVGLYEVQYNTLTDKYYASISWPSIETMVAMHACILCFIPSLSCWHRVPNLRLL